MTKIIVDIETAPTSDPVIIARIISRMKAPAKYSKPESIAEWLADEKNQQEAIGKTSFDGAYGNIVCIGAAVGDEAPFAVANVSERDILQQFFDIVRDVISPVFVGHNVSWDLTFILKRAIVLGITPPASIVTAARSKPWAPQKIDTMRLWDEEKFVGLGELCDILGIESPKGEFDGSMVAAAYAAGRIGEIADYCLKDVRATRDVLRRLEFA